MDDTSSPWSELPGQVEAILAEVWAKLDVDKQLQDAQDKIDEINTGHNEIGEMLDGIEQGLLEMDSELHPTDDNGERISFHADIAETLAKVKSDLESLQLQKEALDDGCHNDDANSDDGFVFMFSDDSASQPPSPKDPEVTAIPSVVDKLEESTAVCHETDDQEISVVDVDAVTDSGTACSTDALPTTGNVNDDKDRSKTESNVCDSTPVVEELVECETSLLQNVTTKMFVDVPTQMTPPRQVVTVEVEAETETKSQGDVADTGKLVSNIANTENPVSSVATTEEPLSNIANIGKLVSSIANTLKPVSDVANTENPVSDVANTLKPVSDVANTEKPVNDQKPELYEDPDVIDLCDGDDNVMMEDDQDLIECVKVEYPKTHVQDSSFRVGQDYKVFAQRSTSTSTWVEATVASMNRDKYMIRFDSKTLLMVSGKQIANKSYPHPSKVHVGSRVIAECKDTSGLSGSSLQAGIIAEIPLLINKTRYLIFFDDGYAQYVYLDELHLIYQASDKAWEDVPRDSREFIQDYLEKYPERPMVRLHSNQTIKTEWNGVWWRAKVIEVDGSLVNMVFPKDNRTEWIYRGSTRLEPLHREMETAKYLRESGRVVAGSSVSKKRGGPCVEYQRVNPLFLVPESEILLLVENARTKSSSRPEPQAGSQPNLKGVATNKAVQHMPVVQWAVRKVRQWCRSRHLSEKFEDFQPEKLAFLLEQIYQEGPRIKPDIFTWFTLQGLRSALSTFLTEPPISHKVDIYKDEEFAQANRVFDEAVKRGDGSKATNKMTVRPGISKRDLVKLLKSGLVSLSNPLGLLRLVWLFMQPFIGRTQGKVKSPDLDLLQKKDVIFRVAVSGLPYYEINSPVLGLSGGQEQKIYATGNRFYCPYHAINLYITKLHPGCQDFLQQPKTRINFKTEAVWFEPRPMSSSFINTMMADIAAAAKMTQMYNNADIRSTTWETLQEAIEEFSENIRMGYRKTNLVQVPETSTSVKPGMGRHSGLPAVVERANQSVGKQTAVTSQTTTGKPSVVRQLLSEPPQVTKRTAPEVDSDDDDVVIIEEPPGTMQSASQRLMHLSNLYKADRMAKQQTAKKSTLNQSQHRDRHHGHHHHRHRDQKYRHESTSLNVVRGNLLPRPSIYASSPIVKKRTKFNKHECSWQCVAPFVPNAIRMQRIKLHNPRSVPGMFGWERRLAKQRGTGRRHVIYHTPCGRTLRNMTEVDRYLTETKMKDLSIDAFNFDAFVYTKPRHYRNTAHFIKINDISNGLEPVPVSLVNDVDKDPPPQVKYIAHRQPERGTKIVLDPGFLICCDCTDNCKDNETCACRMLTVSTAKEFPEIIKNPDEVGYKYRRLMSLVSTGIYECNSKCSCSKRCHNRVAQNGLSLRLQVFKTDKRGWGLRCLDDIPQGAFVCTYAGQLWGGEEANKRGQMYGDEYFAELDHIEVVENSKEGYESNVSEDEGISDSKSLSSNASNSDQCSSSDEDYQGESPRSEGSSAAVDGNLSDHSADLTKAPSSDSATTKMVFRRQQLETETGSQVESSRWSVAFPDKESTRKKVEEWVNNTASQTVKNLEEGGGLGTLGLGQGESSTVATEKDDESELGSQPVAKKMLTAKKEQVALKKGYRKDSNDSSSSSILQYGYSTCPGKVLDKNQIEAFKKRSLTGRLHMRRRSSKDLGSETKTDSITSDDSEHSTADDKKKNDVKSLASDKSLQDHVASMTATGLVNSKDSGNGKGNDKKVPPVRTRSYFGETSGHVMDAKFTGNLGRYINHSCSPNLFVQNVFVDSHDLRFPWVTFFAKKYIRAGWELTWDYNYDVGSVPGRSLICLCGSSECRGRLL